MSMGYLMGTRQTEDDTNFTAAMLQGTLASKNIQAIVVLLWDGPQIETYEVGLLPFGVKPERIEALSGALALAAHADDCRVSRTHGKLLIEIPKPEEARKELRASKMLELTSPTSWHVPLGIGTIGRPVWLNLADERACHVALGGTTRSGKTNLLRWILYRLLVQNGARDLQLLLMDPKGYELVPFAQSKHLVNPPMSQKGEIVKALIWLHQMAMERAHTGANCPRILAVIDEVKELVDQAPAVKNMLASLAQIGAAVGVHLIVTTQQPGSKAMGDALPNFPCRILGRVTSKTLSYGAAGRARSQVELLLGRGDMLLLGEGNRMTRFQAPLVTPDELQTIPTWASTSQIPHLDLPIAVDLGGNTGDVDARGGWNRKSVNMDAVRLAVSLGASASDLHHELGINYDRAQRLVDQFGGDE